MKLYISGPMAGYPDLNFQAFDDMRATLESAGHTVLCPAMNSRLIKAQFGGEAAFDREYPPEGEKRRQFFMREDTALVLQADGVVILPMWWQSRGATYEVTVARELGLPVYYWCKREHELVDIELELKYVAEKLARAENPSLPDIMKERRASMLPPLANRADPRFDRVWECMRTWDISTDGGELYSGATGSHVQAILDALGDVHIGSASGVSKGDDQESITLEADRLVDGARQAAYGHPLDNYEKVAKLWNAYLAGLFGPMPAGLQAEQVIDMMVLMKLGRLLNGAHRDSIVDIAGYAKCRDLCRTERKQRDTVADPRD